MCQKKVDFYSQLLWFINNKGNLHLPLKITTFLQTKNMDPTNQYPKYCRKPFWTSKMSREVSDNKGTSYPDSSRCQRHGGPPPAWARSQIQHKTLHPSLWALSSPGCIQRCPHTWTNIMWVMEFRLRSEGGGGGTKHKIKGWLGQQKT